MRAIAELRKGNNSRIFQVDTRAGRYALKKYPRPTTATGSRPKSAPCVSLSATASAARRRMVAVSPELRYALFTWIDGEPVDAVTDGDVAEFAAFQIALDAAVDARARAEIGEASEACLSGLRIMSHIERRYAKLDGGQA